MLWFVVYSAYTGLARLCEHIFFYNNPERLYSPSKMPRRNSTLPVFVAPPEAGVDHKREFRLRFSGNERNSRSLRILSLDGGGVRGLYSARVLERILERCPFLLDKFDIIAGSSTGGLIAILLGMGYSATSVVQFYRESSHRIFSQSLLRLHNPFLSRYRGISKQCVFRQIIGDLRLKDIPRYLIITAYCCDGIGDTRGIHRTFYQSRRGWRPSLFTNLPRGQGRVDPDDDLLVCDAAMRTTAAPTYFPVYQGYCDGSVFANNPSLSAVARVLSSFPDAVSIDNIVCLSLGTGAADTAIPGKFHDWGLMQWAKWLVDLLFDSTNSSIDMNMHLLLGDRYMRINDALPRAIELDDVTSNDELLAAADAVNINEAVNWCHRYILEDTPTRARSQSMVLPNRRRSFAEPAASLPMA